MPKTPLGRFCWFDLMTTDLGAAPAFYGQVAGWTTGEFDGSSKPYTMWMNGDVPIGGFMQLPDEAVQAGAPPHWLAYVSTPDVKATSAKAKELGGQVLMEMEVPSVGSIALIQDPQGATIGIFQPDSETPGHDGPADLGEFSWHELSTDGWESAWSFYSALFGWVKTDQMDMGEMGIYQMYGRGAHPLGGISDRPATMPVSAWLYFIQVPDVNAAVGTIKALGGSVVLGPMEVPGGDLVAQCLDPAGAAFAVHSKARA